MNRYLWLGVVVLVVAETVSVGGLLAGGAWDGLGMLTGIVGGGMGGALLAVGSHGDR